MIDDNQEFDQEESHEESQEFDQEESHEESQEFDQEESHEESQEVLLEEVPEEEASPYAETTIEISGEVQVINFDSWSTPINSCSAVTISVLLILFFVAIATVGGVLNE